MDGLALADFPFLFPKLNLKESFARTIMPVRCRHMQCAIPTELISRRLQQGCDGTLFSSAEVGQ